MSLFTNHRLIQEHDGYVIELYIDVSTEFASDLLGTGLSPEDNSNLRTQINEYLLRNLPGAKVKTAKILMGPILVATLSLAPMNVAPAYAANIPTVSNHYTVQAGDSLYLISKKFGTTIDELRRLNNLTGDSIRVGQSLFIPKITLPTGVYRIGSRGTEVRTIQQALSSLGYPIIIDGIYGKQSAGIITQIQKKYPDLTPDGIYGPKTKSYLERLLDSEFKVVPNPSDVLVLVNKSNSLTADYVPKDLVIPNVKFSFDEIVPQKYLRQEAATALEQLFAKAKQDNISIVAVSGYRSFDRQADIFARNYAKSPNVNTVSARPGESEHQTGLAMDVSSPSVNYLLTKSFGQTAEGQWLKKNAAQYGFIIRYPERKEAITGYQYEPWHIRYVGKDAAVKIMEQGLTLEEYYIAIAK